MAPSAGYLAKLYYSATNALGTEVAHMNAASLKPMLDMLDTTNFMSSGGDKERIAGLREIDLGTLAGDYDPSDTPQNAIRTAIDGRTAFWLTVLVDGTNGKRVKVVGESYTIASKVADKVTFEFAVKSIAAPTAVP